MLVFECFYLSCLPSPPLPIKWTSPPLQILKTRQEQGEGVCFTHSPNKVRNSFILPNVHHLKYSFLLSTEYRHCLDTWITPPPWKTSTFARFPGFAFVFHHHHLTTLENELVCSFSTVIRLITNFGVTRRCLHLPCHVDNHFGVMRGVCTSSPCQNCALHLLRTPPRTLGGGYFILMYLKLF
jgi:hypothetical protein